MNAVAPSRRRFRPDPAELLSIGEGSRYLMALRAGIAAAAMATASFDPALARRPLAPLLSGAIAYVVVATIPAVLGHRSRRVVVPALQAMLLLDGLAFAAGIAYTGGATSPLRFLLFAHVVGVILIVSYRTGLKLVLWHTLLYLLVSESQRVGLLGGVLDGEQAHSSSIVAFATVAWLWLFALGTSAFAALSERQLRRQKVDLERLSGMVERIEAADLAEEIPRILLEELCATFGSRRGVVLASPTGDLALMASTDPHQAPILSGAVDPVVERAWSGRGVLALREIDPTTDPHLAGLLPDARNVLLVPLFADRGRWLGVVALEQGPDEAGVRRWILAMVTQFATHAALALDNAWLSEERQAKLDEIRQLQDELRAHNADLERRVAERTEELRTVIVDLEEIDRQRRRLLEHVVRASEEERRRIANDVHDDPIQKMIAVKMRLELLRKSHPELEDVQQALEVVRGSIGSLRHLLFDLSPPILDEQGLAPALRSFLQNSEATFGWTVEDELEVQPSSQTRLILYRIAQEALTNARKHSRADHVRILLGERDGGVEMEIADDGVGFLPQDGVVAVPGHMGLAAMRERAEMSGGRCDLHSLPDAGTTLTVWMPLGEEGTGPEPDLSTPVELGARSA